MILMNAIDGAHEVTPGLPERSAARAPWVLRLRSGDIQALDARGLAWGGARRSVRMTVSKEVNRPGIQPRQPLNGFWSLRVRSEVVVCPDCGALLPRSTKPKTCALCGSGHLRA